MSQRVIYILMLLNNIFLKTIFKINCSTQTFCSNKYQLVQLFNAILSTAKREVHVNTSMLHSIDWKMVNLMYMTVTNVCISVNNCNQLVNVRKNDVCMNVSDVW